MQETVNQETNEVKEEVKEEPKFTQEDVNRFFNKRYSDLMSQLDEFKEKAKKYDELEEANKTELQKATERATALQGELDALKNAEKLRLMREKVAHDTGVPVNLLTAESEEACAEQAKQILEFSRPSGYPQVRDGGEVRTSGKKSTRDSFAEWFNNQ